MTGILELLRSFPQQLGDILERGRRFYGPIEDMRITVVALTLGGVLLLGVEAGKDVIRSMVDSANATDFTLRLENIPVFLRWLLFWLACIWTGINAWYWANLLYKSETSSPSEQPSWFRWFRRLLGVLPIICAVIAMPLSARRGFDDTWLAMVLFGATGCVLMWFFISRGKINKRDWRIIKYINKEADPGATSHAPNPLVRGDVYFIWATLVISVGVFIILLIPSLRTDFSWALGPAALAFGAIGCIIPVTSLLIYSTRRYKLPVILLGLCSFVIFSFWNDNHAVRELHSAKLDDRPTVEQALQAWEAVNPDPAVPMVLIAAAGGASRAAYWTATVLRAFDDKSDGKFFDRVFAISSVSGGSLGAIGYAAWLADRPLAIETGAQNQRREFVQDFFGQDYLSPSIGGLLYPDLFQRFFPLPIFPDRAGALEEAFEKGWDKSMQSCEKKPCGAEPGRFSEEYSSIWQRTRLRDAGRRWVPIVLANGTHVETGKRIITAPVKVDSAVFEDTYDFYDRNPKPIRASTAVLNSARFTVVSPPGRLMKDGRANGSIIDGGYFENGGLETVYDLARFIKIRKPDRKIIVIEILNDDTMNERDLARHPAALDSDSVISGLPVAEPPPATFWSPLVSEITSIIGGLYQTRSARGTLGAKRLSKLRSSGLAQTTFYSFKLRPYGKDWHTAMSWALSLGTLDVMDVSFNVRKEEIPEFLKNRGYLPATMKLQIENLEEVISKATANRDALDQALADAALPAQPTYGPGEAAKRK